jgi:hypothetical protein
LSSKEKALFAKWLDTNPRIPAGKTTLETFLAEQVGNQKKLQEYDIRKW